MMKINLVTMETRKYLFLYLILKNKTDSAELEK